MALSAGLLLNEVAAQNNPFGLILNGVAAQITNFERQVLNQEIPKILDSEYKNVPRKELYNISYQTDDLQNREEVGLLVNPGTPNEELIVMGSFGYEENGIRTVTMFTADKHGYRPRVMIKNRKYAVGALKSATG